jgi:molybdopterin synthase sulfur carrier subunit
MPTVLIPTAYRGPTKGEAEVEVEASTVKAALEAVEAVHPGFLTQVIDGGGAVHRFVKLFINEEQIESGGLDVELAAGDRLEVLAAIAGG